MLVQKFTPARALQPYIEGILIQEDFNPTNFANRNPVKVLPTSMTVIGIQYGQPMNLVNNQTIVPMGFSGITGIHSKVKEYISTGAVGTVIVTFKPGGLSYFTEYPLHEFQDMDVPLELAFPACPVRELEDKLAGASSAAERVDIVQQFLLSSLRDNKEEPLILSAAWHIMNRQGALSIERLASELYVSKRTLERQFNTLIGASPKQFARIVRFQRTIYLRHAGCDYLDIVQACGYTDHAHLAKDFKAFAGISPETFFHSEVQPELKKSFNGSVASFPSNEHLYY